MRTLSIGQTLKGQKASYVVNKLLKQDGTVFQAQIKPDIQVPALSLMYMLASSYKVPLY